MSNTNNVMNEGLPSNVICSDPYGCTFEEIVELLGEKSGRAFFRTLYKEKQMCIRDRYQARERP